MQSNPSDIDRTITELEDIIATLKSPANRSRAIAEGIDIDRELVRLEEELQQVLAQRYASLSPWEKTVLARHKDRPYSLDYVRLIFDEFFELWGDRLANNDEAVIGGLARLNGEPVVVIGQQKGRDLKERQRRNFGSARAEGFRKALRLAKLAEKFHKPLISFIDTAGAAADLRAEEHGVSEAIARNLREFALLRTPILVAVIGEGGSGGALGMAVGDRILMLEHAIYSVISPEGCAAILWHDKSQSPEAQREKTAQAADALKLTAQNALRLGVVDEVLPEPVGGAHRDPVAMAATIKNALCSHLGELCRLSADELVDARYRRFRKLGAWAEQED
jgi:acetyl-CoA carboxylase carboxyl transferase subunit alpha